MELDGKVALVTGAARGQGAAHARRFVAEGARVILTDVLDGEGAALAGELGAAALYLRHDVTDAEGWDEAVRVAGREFGRLDVLVNNAGVLLRSPVHQHEVNDFRRVIDVNLTGSFIGIRSSASLLERDGGGSIVNVSSIAGLRALETTAAYTASKFAIRGLTKAAAVDLAPLNIRVNAVLPGIIDTAMTRTGSRTDAQILDRHRNRVLIPRLGRPEEVTEMVLFLASDRSSYVTGADFVIDGGWSAQ
jgi:3alpha(or 20beta)-hydroxysteroid dehydrogenase